MRYWDPDGPTAPVGGVPVGCRAVPLVEVVERAGEIVEVRDRRRRRKTNEVVLVRDPTHPAEAASDPDLTFATGASRRRWATVVGRFGERSFEVALSLVRADVVHLACRVDERGSLGEPRWWEPTPHAIAAQQVARARVTESLGRRDAERASLAVELAAEFPEVAAALRAATTPTAIAVISAAGADLLAGIEHAGPRAFTQAHFGGTKAHDVRGVLTAAGIPASTIERLGLRRGDRIGFGGPIVISTATGTIDLSPVRGPVTFRLDQPALTISTTEPTVVVIENLQAAEAVCARHPGLPVVYTAGQFGDDAALLLEQLGAADKRIVTMVDADLGGVRIARRVLAAVPTAEIIDVGAWPHPARAEFPPDGIAEKGLRALSTDPLVGSFAAAVLARSYPVEQELATLDIVRDLTSPSAPARHGSHRPSEVATRRMTLDDQRERAASMLDALLSERLVPGASGCLRDLYRNATEIVLAVFADADTARLTKDRLAAALALVHCEDLDSIVDELPNSASWTAAEVMESMDELHFVFMRPPMEALTEPGPIDAHAWEGVRSFIFRGSVFIWLDGESLDYADETPFEYAFPVDIPSDELEQWQQRAEDWAYQAWAESEEGEPTDPFFLRFAR